MKNLVCEYKDEKGNFIRSVILSEKTNVMPVQNPISKNIDLQLHSLVCIAGNIQLNPNNQNELFFSPLWSMLEKVKIVGEIVDGVIVPLQIDNNEPEESETQEIEG